MECSGMMFRAGPFGDRLEEKFWYPIHTLS
ncbi:hypothetical protein AHMF7616_05303 [Adhaeribacter pallidiroseus]|uniref:Uncharacterized protein n=1 Tax=Adhaeribacter pallidiroseus TaxID=2072847 RepID=A0A369Q6X4_9BACT|nr:hypothetical protein AHMF7616_05303 [Adhaeribacter pallidiroseus]